MSKTRGIDSMAMPVGLSIVNDLEGEPRISGLYGKELMLDCYQCDTSKFNRTSIRQFFNELVKLLDMKKGDLHFWDDWRVPKAQRQTKYETTGTSAVQFILTSNITIHCLDKLERVYLNIFSCKDFDEIDAQQFTQKWFEPTSIRSHRIYRT